MKTSIKFFLRRITDSLLWTTAYIYAGLIKSKSSSSRGAVIIPADSLIGGFGDDIMVASIIEKISESPIIVFCAKNNPTLSYLNNQKIQQIDGFLPKKYFRFISILRGNSALYLFGADILDGAYDEDATLIRFRILKLAHRMGIKTTISAFSISNEVKPYALKELNAIRRITKLTLRDKSSLERMQTLFPSEKLGLSCDIAFNCPTLPASEIKDPNFLNWKSEQISSLRKIVAICPNAIQAKKLGIDTYISHFSHILDRFCDPIQYSFLFLYHDIRPQCTVGSDKDISLLLHEQFNKKTHSYFSDSISNGVDLKSYIIDSYFTITGRMHFGISGITLGAPMFGIEYQNKFSGLQNLFEVNPDASLIDYTRIPEQIDRTSDFLLHIEEFRRSLAKNIDAIINLSTNYLK